jgi:putative endopeptidase
LSWMNPATKAEAKAKLDTLYVGVGYGESWHDYSNFEVKADDLFGNLWRGRLADYHRQVARLGAPIDRKEWSMTPQTINAVNLPLQNALNFPAGILQPPFFDPKAPAAANYGSIGAVIGHEISHTFDNEGSAFDSKGRVRNWWTPEDLAHFEAATAKLAAQYDTYKPFPDLALNGKQTLGENIADLGGLAASYDAYKFSLSAILSRLRAGLGRKGSRRSAPPAGADRRPFPRPIPRPRGPQPRPLVRRIRGAAGREAVSGARRPRKNLVGR